MMKWGLVLLAVYIPAIGGGQSFDAVVNFNSDLELISNPEAFRAALKDGRAIILEGLVDDATVKETNGEFRVLVTLIGGTWVGTESIRTYSCRVVFRGEQWKDVFVSPRPKDSDSSHIHSGSRLLVAARPLRYNSEENIPVVEMIGYRVLQ